MKTSIACLTALLSLQGCIQVQVAEPGATPGPSSAEWASGPNDLRRTTAVVKVTPPALLKAALERAAAQSDDPDYAAFLRMHASGGFGSGFVMVHRANGKPVPLLVTNRHVVAEAETADVTFADGTTYASCEILLTSTKYDLAVLALPDSALRAVGHGLVPAKAGASDRLAVVAAGYPGVSGRPSYQVTDGKVSNASFSMPEIGIDETLVQHTAAIDPGSSGGPLVDETGALVGVNVMLLRKRSSMFFAVPASAVVETVREARVVLESRRSAPWLAAEIDKACTSLAGELASTTHQGSRLVSFVSNAAVAGVGLQSFAMLTSLPEVAPQLRRDFLDDPTWALRRSILLRLGARGAMGGGATGTCGKLTPADAASLGDGKPVRLAVATKDGRSMELVWTFEHGRWRVLDGDLAVTSPVAGREAAPPRAKGKPAATKTTAKGGL